MRDTPRPTSTHDLDSPEEIAEMVRRFYADVAMDDLLALVFEDVAQVDWSEHLPKLVSFWCRALLGQEGYAGNPFRAHALVHQRQPFTAAHFERWLMLFTETLELGWVGPNADRALALAQNVARVHGERLLERPASGRSRCCCCDATEMSADRRPNGGTMSSTEAPNVDLDSPLGALVAERPARAMVFERFGIDYCCQGRRSLREAIATAGVDEGELVTQLQAVLDERDADVDALGPVELVEHILSTHHAYLHEELPALEALAAKVRDVHGVRHAELAEVARLVSDLRADLEPHLAKEERVLFPAIRELAEGPASFPFGSISNPIRVMLAEHDRVGQLLSQLRVASAEYAVPADGCASYHSLYGRLEHLEADTHRHVHLENNVLFPAVLGQAV